MNNFKRAFTLIEVLIATALLSIVLIGLYSALDTQRRSINVIKSNLDKSLRQDKVILTLYKDIIKSDGNITIKNGERDSICIQNTNNSLYGLDVAKVCWVVLKDKDSLVRIEGGNYKLPLGLENKVEANVVLKGVKLFDIYFDSKKAMLLVVLQELNKEPFSFLAQGIKKPPIIKPKKKKNINKKSNSKEKNVTKSPNKNTPASQNQGI